MTIDAEKKVELFTRVLYAFCVLQFVFFAIFTSTVTYLDKKLVLTLSAVFGLVLASFVRQSHHAYMLKESSKPLDEGVFNAPPQDDQGSKRG